MFLSTGWLVAKVAMALTVLVLAFLLFYVVFSLYRHRRLQLEHERQRQEQALREQEEELVKKKERCRQVKDQLRLVKFNHSNSQQNDACCGENSTCSTANSLMVSCSGHEYKQGQDITGTELDIEAQEVIRSVPSKGNSTGLESETCTATDSESESELDGEGSYENGCPICFATFEDGELVSVSNNAECSHMFHRDCITEWLLKQDGSTCPVCRRIYLKHDEGDATACAEDEVKEMSVDECLADGESDDANRNESSQLGDDDEIDVDDIPV